MIKTLSDSDLLQQLKCLIQEERERVVQILDLLEEVESRKLYLELGFGSLIDFCIEELKYSESAAYRRVLAMRARRDTPEIGESISKGTLSLAVIAKAQSFIRSEERKYQEVLPAEVKVSLFSELENKSIRETEQILIQKSPESALPQEKLRIVREDLIEIRVLLNKCQIENLCHIRSLASHKRILNNYTDTIDWMIDDVLKRLNKGRLELEDSSSEELHLFTSESKDNFKTISERRMTIPTVVRRTVWKRAQGQCCYKNKSTGQRCTSRFQLEIDHIIPVSKGGSNNLSNLQLLCRAHNQWKGMS